VVGIRKPFATDLRVDILLETTISIPQSAPVYIIRQSAALQRL
jgi:hypothetical protein